MSDENRAYLRLKKAFPNAHWQRIESWTGAGIFDVNGCLQKVESWVECKEGTNPKTSKGLVRTKVRPAQIVWEYLRRVKGGGRTFIALLVGEKLFLLEGKHLTILNQGVTRTWLASHDLPLGDLFKP